MYFSGCPVFHHFGLEVSKRVGLIDFFALSEKAPICILYVPIVATCLWFFLFLLPLFFIGRNCLSSDDNWLHLWDYEREKTVWYGILDFPREEWYTFIPNLGPSYRKAEWQKKRKPFTAAPPKKRTWGKMVLLKRIQWQEYTLVKSKPKAESDRQATAWSLKWL